MSLAVALSKGFPNLHPYLIKILLDNHFGWCCAIFRTSLHFF